LRLCAFAGEIFFLYILFVQSQLKPYDPLTITLVTLLPWRVIPARRAAKFDPVVALEEE